MSSSGLGAMSDARDQASTIAFIGLGAMGSRMAQRLLDAGQRLIVWNRTESKTRHLAQAGATVAATPATAASGADVVISMVADAEALQAVTEGDHGVLAGLREGTALVDMSTSGPDAVARLASRLSPTTRLVDAPVLGSVAEAESGTLTIFAGGPAALVERVSPLLSALGRVVHVGPLGSGTAAKLIANASLFNTLGALGEALALGDALGLSRDATYQVLDLTPLAAQAVRRRPAIEANDYPARFRLALACNDAGRSDRHADYWSGRKLVQRGGPGGLGRKRLLGGPGPHRGEVRALGKGGRHAPRRGGPRLAGLRWTDRGSGRRHLAGQLANPGCRRRCLSSPDERHPRPVSHQRAKPFPCGVRSSAYRDGHTGK
jgi:3-hydroxyisobutyrate dehydrogenase-like beta-hydroxyacid dehydrogenase